MLLIDNNLNKIISLIINKLYILNNISIFIDGMICILTFKYIYIYSNKCIR